MTPLERATHNLLVAACRHAFGQRNERNVPVTDAELKKVAEAYLKVLPRHDLEEQGKA